MLQPYWSSRWWSLGTISDGKMVHESVQQSSIQLSSGGGPANKEDEVIEPNTLVSSFAQKHFPNIDGVKKCNYEKKKKRNYHQSNCIDMKLTKNSALCRILLLDDQTKSIFCCARNRETLEGKGKLLQ